MLSFQYFVAPKIPKQTFSRCYKSYAMFLCWWPIRYLQFLCLFLVFAESPSNFQPSLQIPWNFKSFWQTCKNYIQIKLNTSIPFSKNFVSSSPLPCQTISVGMHYSIVCQQFLDSLPFCSSAIHLHSVTVKQTYFKNVILFCPGIADGHWPAVLQGCCGGRLMSVPLS